MIRYLVPQTSSFADDIDGVFMLVVVIVGFWFFATMFMFLYLTFKYRAKEGVPAQYITGKEKDLKRWITIPHGIIILCDVLLIAGAVKVWYDVKQDLPEPDQTIRVIAQQWAWTFIHPGPDGQIDTEDDIAMVDELHLEVGKTYHWKLESRDVLHSFSIPTFRMKQDAIPGREITGWFEPTVPGVYDIQCAEMCGIAHGIMGARLFVETAAQHSAWVDSKSSTAVAAR